MTYSRIRNHHRLVVDVVGQSFAGSVLRIAKVLSITSLLNRLQ